MNPMRREVRRGDELAFLRTMGHRGTLVGHGVLGGFTERDGQENANSGGSDGLWGGWWGDPLIDHGPLFFLMPGAVRTTTGRGERMVCGSLKDGFSEHLEPYGSIDAWISDNVTAMFDRYNNENEAFIYDADHAGWIFSCPERVLNSQGWNSDSDVLLGVLGVTGWIHVPSWVVSLTGSHEDMYTGQYWPEPFRSYLGPGNIGYGAMPGGRYGYAELAYPHGQYTVTCLGGAIRFNSTNPPNTNLSACTSNGGGIVTEVHDSTGRRAVFSVSDVAGTPNAAQALGTGRFRQFIGHGSRPSARWIDAYTLLQVVGYSRQAYVSAGTPPGYHSREVRSTAVIQAPAGCEVATVNLSLTAEVRPYGGGALVAGTTSVMRGGSPPDGDKLDQYWLDVFDQDGVLVDRYWLNYRSVFVMDPGKIIASFDVSVGAGWSLQYGSSASDGISAWSSANNSGNGITFVGIPGQPGKYEAGVVLAVQWNNVVTGTLTDATADNICTYPVRLKLRRDTSPMDITPVLPSDAYSIDLIEDARDPYREPRYWIEIGINALALRMVQRWPWVPPSIDELKSAVAYVMRPSTGAVITDQEQYTRHDIPVLGWTESPSGALAARSDEVFIGYDVPGVYTFHVTLTGDGVGAYDWSRSVTRWGVHRADVFGLIHYAHHAQGGGDGVAWAITRPQSFFTPTTGTVLVTVFHTGRLINAAWLNGAQVPAAVPPGASWAGPLRPMRLNPGSRDARQMRDGSIWGNNEIPIFVMCFVDGNITNGSYDNTVVYVVNVGDAPGVADSIHATQFQISVPVGSVLEIGTPQLAGYWNGNVLNDTHAVTSDLTRAGVVTPQLNELYGLAHVPGIGYLPASYIGKYYVGTVITMAST